jgi:serine-type D-Ala-D-Ala carboxypeptidase (penicillin-binding protein 5/6)
MRLPARLSAVALSAGLLVTLAATGPAAASAGHAAATGHAAARSVAASAGHAAARSVAAARYPGGVQAPGAALENAATGALLWSRGLTTERPMASITKVMTALVVIRAGRLNRPIRVPAAVTAYVRNNNASNAGLRPGDRLSARELLEAMLLPSGCDAAYTLARAYGPGLTAFVARMNAAAAAMGLARTHFANFDGLPWPTEHSTYSTPRDLITLGRAAMRSAVFRSIVVQRGFRLAATGRHHAYFWPNTNFLLGRYPGAIGIKTGSTLAAGYCLLFEARRGPIRLIGVVLHSSHSNVMATFSDATKLLNWGFAHM